MDDFKDFASYLTDDEISKVAPMIERIKALDSRKIKQESFNSIEFKDDLNLCLASIY